MKVRTNKQLKNALVLAMGRSDNYDNLYKNIVNVVLGDLDAVWGNARSHLMDMGMDQVDMNNIRNIIRKRF